jgi:hypothetical protein
MNKNFLNKDCDVSKKRLIDTNEKTPMKDSLIFECLNCNFSCKKTSDWARHISTDKHNRINNSMEKEKKHICSCGREYSHLSSLCNHRKKCTGQKQSETNRFVAGLRRVIFRWWCFGICLCLHRLGCWLV